jgi:RHS repeat-associated protein
VTQGGLLKGTYTYNGLEQVAVRVVANSGSSNGTVHAIYDIKGNLIAETAGGGATGATGTVREYIWLHDVEIAPTKDARVPVDRPIAVVAGVNTASPVTLYVHVDHLHRPIRMTNAAKATVWSAVWLPWGGVHSITGTETLNARFPGQWFQIENGLHYNWHRHYDSSIGRYTQPDPLGFVDGPSVYGYAKNAPQNSVDPTGQWTGARNADFVIWPRKPSSQSDCPPSGAPPHEPSNLVEPASWKDFCAGLKKKTYQIMVLCALLGGGNPSPPTRPSMPPRPQPERPIEPPKPPSGGPEPPKPPTAGGPKPTG